MKKSLIKKQIPIKSRHIEYNYEISPDNTGKMRYHLVIIDDKNRKAKLSQLIRNLGEWGEVITIREPIERKVTNSKLRLIFQSFDSNQKPEMLRLSGLKTLYTRNRELYEGKSSERIINYIERRFCS